MLDSRPDAPAPAGAEGVTAVIRRTGSARTGTGTGTGTTTLATRTGEARPEPHGPLPDDPSHGDDGWSDVLGSHPSAVRGDGRAGSSTTEVDLPRRRRRRPGMAAVLLVLLLLSVLAAGGLWWTEAGPGAQREVPDLRGRTAEAGAEQLAAIGIGSSTTPVFDDVAPAGVVVDTRPGPGGSVHKNGSVVLVVSAGPELFAVPDLRGRSQEEAAADLTAARLGLGAVTEAYDPQVAAGQVVSSDPPAGDEVREATPVSVVLSLGPQPVPVPAVTGGTTDDARAALEGAGLRLGGRTERFDDAPAGTVVEQVPADGTLLPGATVEVVVSLGPEPVEVPAVFEQRFDTAAATLQELGFVVERRGSDIFGRVVSQDPTAGTELPPGSTVVLTTF